MAPLPHRRALFSFLGLGAACLLLLKPGVAQQDNRPVVRFVSNPDPAPEFTLKGLDGRPVSLADYRGKVVLLNFWATWCGPCRAEIPDLVDLQSRYQGRLQIIGLNPDDDDAEVVEKYVQENGINYPVAMVSADLRMQYGGIPALPTSFVVDAQGRVMQKHVGLWNPQVYETEVRALLGMPIMARVETFEDKGEVFLKHADRATELPGVDLSKLTAEQKKIALHRFNADTCTCGCNFTLAQCRIWDSACAVSKAATEKIVAEVSAPAANSGDSGASPAKPGANPPPAPTKPASAPSPAAAPSPKPSAPSTAASAPNSQNY